MPDSSGRARQTRSIRVGPLMPLVGVVALVIVGLLLGWHVALGLVLTSCPLVLAVFTRARTSSLAITPGLYLAVAFTVFFGAGLLRWQLNGESIKFYQIGPVPYGPVLTVLFWLSLAACGLILGEHLILSQVLSANSKNPSPAFIMFTYGICFLALFGAALLVMQLGGLSRAVEVLQPHDKTLLRAIPDSVGLTLWSIFALPAAIAAGSVALRPTSTRVRGVVIVQALLICSTGVVLFGSRLTLTLVAVGVSAVAIGRLGRRLRLWHVVAGLGLLLVLTSYVYAGRGESTARDSESPIASGLDVISYSLFDVAVAAWLAQDELGPEYRSLDRAGAAASSVVPAFGSDRVDVEDARVDVMTVRAIGRLSHAHTTGLPPSLPAFMITGFGGPIGAILCLAIGVVAGLGTKFLISSVSFYGSFMFGLWTAFVFNTFKDGDLIINLGTEVRRWAYVCVVYLSISILLWAHRGRKAVSV
jgi:hypothetical protein